MWPAAEAKGAGLQEDLPASPFRPDGWPLSENAPMGRASLFPPVRRGDLNQNEPVNREGVGPCRAGHIGRAFELD